MKHIYKVQLPLFGSGMPAFALAYNRNRDQMIQLPITDELKKLMGEDVKAFFYAELSEDDGLKLGKRAPFQSW